MVYNNQNLETELPTPTIGGLPCSLGDFDVDIIGDLSDKELVYVLKVWKGSGYFTDFFAVNADYLEDALNKFYLYCENKGYTDYIFTEEEHEENLKDWIEYHGDRELAEDSCSDISCDEGYIQGENFDFAKYDLKTFISKFAKKQAA